MAISIGEVFLESLARIGTARLPSALSLIFSGHVCGFLDGGSSLRRISSDNGELFGRLAEEGAGLAGYVTVYWS